MYVKVTEGRAEKYTFQQLRRDNPNTSFPQPPSAETLACFGVFHLAEVVTPEFSGLTERCTLGEIRMVNGKWVQSWDVTPLPASLRVKKAKAARASAYAAEADPLFFKAQRGEATAEEWQDKVRGIRERFPYPEE